MSPKASPPSSSGANAVGTRVSAAPVYRGRSIIPDKGNIPPSLYRRGANPDRTQVSADKPRGDAFGDAPLSPYLTVPELGAVLRVPVSTVYTWTRQVGPDTIPCYLAGKRLVFDREEVLAWFKRTQRREGWHPPTRGGVQRVAARSKRTTPEGQSGGRRGRKPRKTGLPAATSATVAPPLPYAEPKGQGE